MVHDDRPRDRGEPFEKNYEGHMERHKQARILTVASFLILYAIWVLMVWVRPPPRSLLATRVAGFTTHTQQSDAEWPCFTHVPGTQFILVYGLEIYNLLGSREKRRCGGRWKRRLTQSPNSRIFDCCASVAH